MALLLLFFILSLAFTAALAAFQTFCNHAAHSHAKARHTGQIQTLLQKPQRVLVSGVFLTTTLQLLMAFCVFHLLGTFPFLSGTSYGWAAFAALLGLAILLLLIRTYASAWGRKQSSEHKLGLLPVVQLIYWLGTPFAAFFLPMQQAAGRTRYAFGAPSASEELTNSIDQVQNEPISPQEKGLLKAIVNFSTITVRQIMRSRVDVLAFQYKLPFPALIQQIQQKGYSRVPVYTDGLDKINGILYVKDLLPYLNAPEDFVWQNLIRTPYFVPETQKIDDLLREFQERRVHMAIVVNEYGDTTGLLTLEDVLEEIVGEIHDELDEAEDHYFTQLEEHTFLFEGRTSLHDFCKIMDPPPELLQDVRQEVESVAGLMLRLFSRIPHTGEEVTLGPYVFTIEAADSKKIKKIRVHEVVPHPSHEEE